MIQLGTPGLVPLDGLGAFPTPLQPLNRLSAAIGAEKTVLAKRDDLCGVGAGGNKVRKLRRLLADALARGASTVITTGGVQSNSCALTALCAASVGLCCEQFLTGHEPARLTGNLLISREVNAAMHFIGEASEESVTDQMDQRSAELGRDGHAAVIIPVGGSTPLGTSGIVDVIDELASDPLAASVTDIALAAGSMGTMAGLIIGTWLHDLPWTVHGYSVSLPQADAVDRLERLLTGTRNLYFPQLQPRRNYRIDDSTVGDGYSRPTPAGVAAVQLVAQREGILLDSTYTAKAMAGMIADHAAGRLGTEGSTVFYHSGGLAGYFA